MPKLVPDGTLETLKEIAKKAPVTPKSPVETQDRLTMIIRFVHEHWGEEPFSVEGLSNKLLKEKVEPYKRRITVGPEWKHLDLGGIDPETIGMVVLENNEGKNLTTNPTPEQRVAIAKKIVEVAYREDSSEADIIGPGEMLPKFPADASKLLARCQSGSANCRVYIVSK